MPESTLEFNTARENKIGGALCLVAGIAVTLFVFLGKRYGIGQFPAGNAGVAIAAAFGVMLVCFGAMSIYSSQRLSLAIDRRTYEFESRTLMNVRRHSGSFDDIRDVRAERETSMGTDERQVRWIVALYWNTNNDRFIIAARPEPFGKSAESPETETRRIAQQLREILGKTTTSELASTS